MDANKIPGFRVLSINTLLSLITAAFAAFFIFTACSRPDTDLLQGYIEGEFVYVSSPYAGTLKTLHVRQGAQVKAGDALFTLENISEKSAKDEAEWRLKQARENLEDLQKGKRSSEMEALDAQLKQAEAALSLSEKELSRMESLFTFGLTSAQAVDRARSDRDQNRERVSQLKADIKTAQLGSRSDQIAAAKSNVQALEAVLASAEGHDMLARGEVQFVVNIPENFTRDLLRGNSPPILVEADATDPSQPPAMHSEPCAHC